MLQNNNYYRNIRNQIKSIVSKLRLFCLVCSAEELSMIEEARKKKQTTDEQTEDDFDKELAQLLDNT